MPSPSSTHLTRRLGLRQPRWLRDRSERLHWLVVIGLAALAVAIVLGAESRANAAAERWGERAPAVQATASLSPVAPVRDSDVALVEVPLHLLPDGALSAGDDLAALGAPTQPIPAGTLLTTFHFERAVDVRSDRRAVPIPAPFVGILPPVGDPIELIVSPVVDPYAPEATSPLVVAARLLEVTEDNWLVEVAATDAVLLATAATSGTVVPVLLPG